MLLSSELSLIKSEWKENACEQKSLDLDFRALFKIRYRFRYKFKLSAIGKIILHLATQRNTISFCAVIYFIFKGHFYSSGISS